MLPIAQANAGSYGHCVTDLTGQISSRRLLVSRLPLLPSLVRVWIVIVVPDAPLI